MKFGKLQDISNVEFNLPPDPASTDLFLDQQSTSKKIPKLFIGCTGWSMKEWLGKVYPSNCKPTDYLYYYSRQFNTIELNTTHYRIPDEKTITKWKEQTPFDFRFCPKIPQMISHSSDLGYSSDKVSEFCKSIEGLEEKLGTCFMQLPPHFGPDKITLLKYFLDQFPKYIPISIELRKADWFKEDQKITSFFDYLRERGVSLVITDVAGRRDVLHQQLTHSTLLIRFVGNDLHSTDYTRIDDWIERMGKWIKGGIDHIYFFPHEPDNLLAPELAAYLYQQVKVKLPELVTRGPELNRPHEGEQISLF